MYVKSIGFFVPVGRGRVDTCKMIQVRYLQDFSQYSCFLHSSAAQPQTPQGLQPGLWLGGRQGDLAGFFHKKSGESPGHVWPESWTSCHQVPYYYLVYLVNRCSTDFLPHEQYYLAGLDVICDEIKQKTQAIGMLDHVGKAFIEALKHTDLDPIYFCEAGVCVWFLL